MRACVKNIDEVKRKISELKGKSLSVAVNKGRKKTVTLDGIISDVFPSVFTFRPTGGELVSFAYSDVICGDIVISEAECG